MPNILPPEDRKSRAQIQRDYRARQKASGVTDARIRKRVQINTRATRWDTGEFVAIDGEGFSEGKEFRVTVGDDGSIYTGKRHYYAYLAASDGTDIYSAASRLSTGDCLSFVCDIVDRNSNAIIVCFGGSYDVCHMVAHGCTTSEIATLLGRDGKNNNKSRRVLDATFGDYQYRLEYRPRKSFTIRRWPIGVRKYEYDRASEKWKPTKHTCAIVWDVWGFFQDSFVGVMKKWLPGDADYEFIKRMKGERSIFERHEIEAIKIYNAAELRCLVKIMEAVRAAIGMLGLKITRWDGAGAIAAAFMQKHQVKEYKGKSPPEVFNAARCAYSGGHIEVCKMGYHKGKVHHYDINSAYPDQFRRLPNLSTGRWQRGTNSAPPKGFTLVNVRYEFQWGMPFYPLFFRERNGSIIYPARGCGWYWYPEFDSAQKFALEMGCRQFKVMEWWSYQTDVDIRPFGWVEDYYSERQAYISEAKKRGVESGPEKIIKLGLNSLYGKTAQQVGARIDKEGEVKEPAYFQLEWAGYVTAGCRATLMEAALKAPYSIIGFATDGIFSTEPLNLYSPAEKELGAWEYKIHDGITMVMPGVYWLHDGEQVQNFSRGFGKKEMSDAQFIHAAWRQKQTSVPVTITRLIGLGSASMSKDFWALRGMFCTSRRTLRLDGDNSKRYPVMLYKCRPETGLVQTEPRDHLMGDNLPLDELVSRPYPIAWLDGGILLDELEGEMADEREMMDAELA